MSKCEHCGKEGAKERQIAGSVFSDLCAVCRTDLHTYVSSELPLSEFLLKQLEISTADDLVKPSLLLDFLDLEEELHNRIKAWIRGT